MLRVAAKVRCRTRSRPDGAAVRRLRRALLGDAPRIRDCASASAPPSTPRRLWPPRGCPPNTPSLSTTSLGMPRSPPRPSWHLSRTGRDVGTPIITFEPPDGLSFFGPVISRVPSDEQAVPLWNAVIELARFPGFAELKRSLREAPQLRILGTRHRHARDGGLGGRLPQGAQAELSWPNGLNAVVHATDEAVALSRRSGTPVRSA